MATWAKGVDFKNSANNKRIGGVGVYGNDGTAQKVYLGLGTEPWNNQGLELTSSTIKFKGTDLSLSNHNHDSTYLKTSATAASSNCIARNNTEAKDQYRMQFLQMDKNSTINPDTGWWSLVRTQHGGYANGYWQEMAYSFSADTVRFRRNVNGTLGSWKTFAWTDSNVASATKLATARSINGTNFDGTGNITTANWGTARTLTIGNTGKSVNGSGNVSWSLSEIGALAVSAKAADSDKVDGLHSNAFCRAHSGSYGLGGNQEAITTAQFVSMLSDLGAFNQPYWVTRGSWSYAANKYINDTQCGNIHLAGCTVEVMGTSSAYTIRVHAPTTSASGIANADYIYVNNGSSYAPSWRRLINDKGGTFKEDVEFNKYVRLMAWPGYGSGHANLWFNGTAGNVHCNQGLRTDKNVVAAKMSIFEDGVMIPTRGGNRHGVLFNTYGEGEGSYLEIVKRNTADTDWEWGYSTKMYRTRTTMHTLELESGGQALKIRAAADHCYVGFYPRANNPDYRGTWMGYGSAGSNDFWISATSGNGRVNLNSVKSFAESHFCRSDTFIDPAPGFGMAIKTHGGIGVGGAIIMADGSSGEKLIKYNYAQQSRGWGIYFNDSNSGWYDWQNNRGVWSYNPGGGTFDVHRSTSFHMPVRFLSSVEGIRSVGSIYSRTGLVYSSSLSEKKNVVKLNSKTKAASATNNLDVILKGIRDTEMATYNYIDKDVEFEANEVEVVKDGDTEMVECKAIKNKRSIFSDKDTYIGFIAEEIENSNNEFFNLIGSCKTDENGEQKFEIREMSVIGALWVSLQEAWKEIDELKSKGDVI